MITASDFRNGKTFEIDGKPYVVLEFQHVKPGKGAAFVRTKYKDIISGTVREEAFKPEAKFEEAHIDRKDMQYSYDDGDMYNFMDNETYEMLAIAHDEIADAMRFVTENTTVKVCSYKGKVFSIEPPITMILKVVETEPGVKGDTAANVTKPATLETGAVVKVPIFINADEYIVIDTRTGEYNSRSKGPAEA